MDIFLLCLSFILEQERTSGKVGVKFFSLRKLTRKKENKAFAFFLLQDDGCG